MTVNRRGEAEGAQPITIRLSPNLRSALEDAARHDAVPVAVIVERALRRHLFVQRLHEMRVETLALLRDTGTTDLKDEDVFGMVS